MGFFDFPNSSKKIPKTEEDGSHLQVLAELAVRFRLIIAHPDCTLTVVELLSQNPPRRGKN